MSFKALAVGSVVVAATAFGAVATPLHAQDRPRVAVIPFDNPTQWWGRQLGASAAGQLTVELVNSGAFTVLERQRVEAVFDEWYLGQSGAVTAEQAAQVGKLLGVDYLITGQVVSFNVSQRGGRFGAIGASETRAESSLSVRAVSVTTGEILFATKAEGNENLGRSFSFRGQGIDTSTAFDPTLADQALGPAIKTIATALTEQRAKFETTSPAAAAPAIAGRGDDGSVYIDQGQNAGMTAGRRFRVLRVVDEIRDRDGKLLDRITKQVGVIEVTRVLSQSAICTIVEGEIIEDDILEPIEGA